MHIGHSVGGHVMPLPHNAHKISHAITVGAQNAFVNFYFFNVNRLD